MVQLVAAYNPLGKTGSWSAEMEHALAAAAACPCDTQAS